MTECGPVNFSDNTLEHKSMPITMITVANFAANGGAALDRYVAGTLPLLQQAGAKVVRYGGTEALLDDSYDLVAIMEFPHRDALDQFWNSDAYLTMEAYRDEAFSDIRTFICQSLAA